MIHQVTAGEDPFNVGASGGGFDRDVALVVDIHHTAHEFRSWVVADGDEQAGHGKFTLLTRHGVLDHDAAHLVFTENIDYLGVPHRLDLLVGQHAFGHHLAGA